MVNDGIQALVQVPMVAMSAVPQDVVTSETTADAVDGVIRVAFGEGAGAVVVLGQLHASPARAAEIPSTVM